MLSLCRRSFIRGLGARYSSVVGEDFVVRSSFSDVEIVQKPVPERVFEFSSRWPDLTALVCGATGRSYTYATLERRARTLAASLRVRLGVREEDNVAILLPNCPEYPAVTLAAMMTGASVALVNPAYKSNELKHHFVVAKPKVIVAAAEIYSTVKATLDDMKVNTPIIVIDNGPVPQGAIKYSELSEAPNIDLSCLKTVKISPEDIAILPFSSGTTGLPKAVALPHRALVASSYICSHPGYIMNVPATGDHQDVVHAILPFYHIYGHVSVMLNCLVHGTKLVTMPAFTPELYLKVLAEHRSTIMYAVPPIIQFVTKHPLAKPEYLAATREVICGGANLPPVEVGAFEAKHKNTELLQAYGLTETTALGCATAKGTRKERDTETSGTVFANMAMKITALDTQKNLGPNQKGELWVRGPVIMSGYYGNPEHTKAALTEDGWLRTGDIGYYNDKGYFYITERLKELIKVKGFQVAPAELEGVLLSHPAVLDAGVVGVPTNDGSGEQPIAFVALKPGASVGDEDLKKFVASQVTEYKRLAVVKVVESIPKTNTGKILRRELRRLYDENK